MVMTRLSHSGGICPLSRTGASCSENSASPSSNSRSLLHMLDLPIELIERVFTFLSYKEISHARSVCKKFDSVAANLLTKSFYRLQSHNFQLLQSMRSQMPRRESLRRKHPLASQCDIIETINMRFDLLQMTFGKHMERKFICFFPGEILDEVMRVSLAARTPSSANERLTDELCDLSTMAMEYFREHLDAGLRSSLLYQRATSDSTICDAGSPGPGSTCASSVVDSSVGSGDSDLMLDWSDDCCSELSSTQLAVINSKIAKLNKSLKKNNMQMVMLRRELRSHRQRCQEQSRIIADYAARIDDHDSKLDETSLKFSTVLQDLSECRRQLSQWSRVCSQRCVTAAAGNNEVAVEPLTSSPQRPAVLNASDTEDISTDNEVTRDVRSAATSNSSANNSSRHGKRKLSDVEGSGGSSRRQRPLKLRRQTTH